MKSKKTAKISDRTSKNSATKIRYAVVGLGHIAQNAILPGFLHAENSELTALVSGDPVKLKKLAKRYGVKNTYSYDQYMKCLESGLIDAVYIALPNSQHREYAESAAARGIHILCEKPLAVTPDDCLAMRDAAKKYGVKLMTAYRLHFEKANLEAIEILSSGKIGDVRYFISTFSQTLRPGNTRSDSINGTGPIFDMGIYCINASRYLFRENPLEVFAFSSRGKDSRFKQIDEMESVILRYPDGKLATFTNSFGGASSDRYEIIGTKGTLSMDSAYGYIGEKEMTIKLASGKTGKKTFKEKDQFAAELLYFSDCILKNKPIEPNATEGLIDVKIIEAVVESARTGLPVKLNLDAKGLKPSVEQEVSRPAPRRPRDVHAESPAVK
jgi:predicted dehydrogenase